MFHVAINRRLGQRNRHRAVSAIRKMDSNGTRVGEPGEADSIRIHQSMIGRSPLKLTGDDGL